MTAKHLHVVFLFAQQRAGHIPLLQAYANRLDTTVDPKYPSCGEEPQTVEHWLGEGKEQGSQPIDQSG